MLKLRPEWWNSLCEPDEHEIWRELAHDLELTALDMGALRMLRWLAGTASHALQINKQGTVNLSELDAEAVLECLYQEYVREFERPAELISRKEERNLTDSYQARAAVGRVLLQTEIQSDVFCKYWAYVAVAVTLAIAVLLSSILQHPISSNCDTSTSCSSSQPIKFASFLSGPYL